MDRLTTPEIYEYNPLLPLGVRLNTPPEGNFVKMPGEAVFLVWGVYSPYLKAQQLTECQVIREKQENDPIITKASWEMPIPSGCGFRGPIWRIPCGTLFIYQNYS